MMAAAPAVYASWTTATCAICLITPPWNELSGLLFSWQLFIWCPEEAEKTQGLDDEDVDTSFQTRGRGCQNCLFWQPCTFLANKRQLCARGEKSFAKSSCSTSNPHRELTNSWPSIYRGLQWTCHHPLWCISIRFLLFFCHLQMGPLFIKAAAVNLPSSCKRRLWCLEA